MSHKTRRKSATDAAKEGQNFCKTFKFELSADDVDFHCFSCGVNFYLTKSCTALNDAALLGVKELGKIHFFCAMTVRPENSEIGS